MLAGFQRQVPSAGRCSSRCRTRVTVCSRRIDRGTLRFIPPRHRGPPPPIASNHQLHRSCPTASRLSRAHREWPRRSCDRAGAREHGTRAPPSSARPRSPVCHPLGGAWPRDHGASDAGPAAAHGAAEGALCSAERARASNRGAHRPRARTPGPSGGGSRTAESCAMLCGRTFACAPHPIFPHLLAM
jgi:hypothetical protein